jgi:hypothetical protein
MWERGKKKMMEVVNSRTIYLVYCRKFCKCYNEPTAQQQKTIHWALVAWSQRSGESLVKTSPRQIILDAISQKPITKRRVKQ